MKFAYHVVDVFTQAALEGNPLAVFPDARGLDTTTMQRIARELNLSETTFIFPSEDKSIAGHVRIFTPATEMEFAGHPTIGTAYVMRMLGMVEKSATEFVLQENIGPVPVRVGPEDDPILWLKTPPITCEGEYPKDQCASALSLDTSDIIAQIPCELFTAGNPNVFVPLKSKDAVDRAVVDTLALSALFKNRTGPTCIFAFTPTDYGAYSRMFAPDLGIIEDPATGSATGPLAAFMMKHRLVGNADATRFLSEQGTKMGRRSLLHVLVHGPSGERGIEVGGNVAPLAVAELELSLQPVAA